MNYPKDLEKLISYFQKLPCIGEKSAERLAIATLEFSDEEAKEFSDSIISAKKNLTRCQICGHLTDKEICDICSDEGRNKNIICVIEDYKSIFSFEKTGTFKGTYHVLNGLISPLDGIGPDEINLSKLVDRVNSSEVKEIILALKPSIEGETTMQYLKKILSDFNVKISKIATGVPLGMDMEYIDTLTLELALEERKDITSHSEE